MLRTFNRIFKHSLLMMKIHWQAYMTLSITISISLGLFLGILFYSDTNYFNQYKVSSSTPANAIQISEQSEATMKRAETLSKRYEDTFVIKWQTSSITVPPYRPDSYTFYGDLHFVDRNFFFYPYFNGKTFTLNNLVAGRLFTQEELSEHHRVILLEEKFASLFFESNQNALENEFLLPTQFETGSPAEVQPFKIIGIIKSYENYPTYFLDNKDALISGNIFLAQSLKPYFRNLSVNHHQLIVSDSEDSSKTISSNLLLMGIQSQSTTSARLRAQLAYIQLREYQIPVLAVLLFVLAINMYSLHNNVLKNRHQEIAIKRALGVSRSKIMLEFFIEGMIIFLLNLFAICFIVFSVGVIWYFFNHTSQQGPFLKSLIIYPHSLKLFLVVSISMTVLNSVVLSYLATQINIIDAIKTE